MWSGGISLGIGSLSGLLSLVLSSVGDRSGAEAVRGVTLVAATTGMLALIALVVILAVKELQQPENDHRPTPHRQDAPD